MGQGAFTVADLKELFLDIPYSDNDRVVYLRVKTGPNGTSEHAVSDEDFKARVEGVIREAELFYNDSRQIDGEDWSVCIIELRIGDA